MVRTRPIVDVRGRFVRILLRGRVRRRPLTDALAPEQPLPNGGGRRDPRHALPASPAAEAKLVRCLSGRVFDVAIDLRRNSATFLAWHGIELTADNDTMLFIPEGFAHGFQVLSDEAELLYMHSADFNPAHDGRLRIRRSTNRHRVAYPRAWSPSGILPPR